MGDYQNLILNPYFTSTSNWQGITQPSNDVVTLPTPPGTINTHTTSLRLNFINTGMQKYQDVAISASTNYYIRYYIACIASAPSGISPGTVRFIRDPNGDNEIIFNDSYDNYQSSTWTAVTKSYTSGSQLAAGTYRFRISFTPSGTDEYYITDIYVGTLSSYCLNKGTKILSLRGGIEQYIPIEELNKETDLVKTHLHGFKKINNIGHSVIVNDVSDFTKSMYIMEKTNDMIDDLIVTGGHSILEDEYDNTETKSLHMELFGGSLDPIDDKVLVLAGKSSKFRQIDNKETYDIYHIALGEDCDEDKRYGIWANGILTESTYKKVLYKMISFN
jgi:hypothetical protein